VVGGGGGGGGVGGEGGDEPNHKFLGRT
jgi:hypothetical protein